jgi:Fic family protein
METTREQDILGIILQDGPIGISEIQKRISENISIPTLNRALSSLKKTESILTIGKGPSLKYSINLKNIITAQINVDNFFKIETDERKIIERFNFDIFERLSEMDIFTKTEILYLEALNESYQQKIANLSEQQFTKEFERLMIELSWKSSQIEGNTYDLLDTEQLLKYNVPSKEHSIEETQMLLNHKKAIEYTFFNRDIFDDLSISKIIDIHTLLTQEMGIIKNLRKRIVRITGTKYLPPDNEFLVQEAMEKLCRLINKKENIFEKAVLSILLLSYIQPFEDGNKRTARLTGNAILMNGNCCPLSYRSINPSDYKKAVLLFYELNNISSFKQIFINQFEFAVNTYF